MSILMQPFEDEYRLETELIIPETRARVFEFFSDARNLEKLTPDSLRFSIVTPEPIDMKVDAVIQYRLKIRGIPVRWKTLISEWNPPFSFVDEQIKGPYRYWIHRHTFEEVDGGTLVKDLVRYQVPGGALVNKFFVTKDVLKIFSYRQEFLANKYKA